MADIVGIRYKPAGRIYYFDPGDFELSVGESVVVETSLGHEMGQVVIAPTQIADDEITQPLKPVVRRADEEDMEQARQLRAREPQALSESTQVVEKLELPMKLISAEHNLEGNRLTIYFSAEGRIDFREMVRELSRRLRLRVELRQVGPRDEAKLMGGFGRCGRGLCCSGFLSEFGPVSIKMAKEQNLPLNPAKISGVCGRLLCCLDYEYEHYREQKAKMPREGDQVDTPMGKAIVIGGNPLEEKVKIELVSGEKVELPLAEINIENKASSRANQ
ncbi:MAG: regulatory iron-sulfur-containing complex subunit RicT, partial [Dehalococcoidales bacterium]